MKLKKRRFKYRIIGYAFIMFIGYQISFNIIMNHKLVKNNEQFIKAILSDSNYTLLYKKKEDNLLNKIIKNIINVNKPITILDNAFHTYHMKENKIKKSQMAYVSNPNLDNKQLEKKPEVLLYNSHQSETYEGNSLEGYNITPGVMMASYLLQNKLAENNIKSIVLEDNLIEYMNINNMNHSQSYIASRTFIENIINNNPQLKLILDIHRDSVPKEKTTTIINNKLCAKILFVIGEEYDTYQKNLVMTQKLNSMIEEKYPELSKGIITKGGKGNNGIYNQDLNDKVTLIEIGTEESSIEEVLNTIELLAPIIGEFIDG